MQLIIVFLLKTEEPGVDHDTASEEVIIYECIAYGTNTEDTYNEFRKTYL